MWKLTIEDDEGKQTGLPLAHDEYGLGRSEMNSIRLTDRNVSRKHAVLSKNGQGWLIKDLESYNGTYVNGGRVFGEQHLRHGDLVQLGDYRLELIDEALTSAAPTPAPMLGRGTTLSPLHSRPNRLVMVVGPTPGVEFPLDGERLMIGRSEDANVSINHSSVSRQHAELISLGNGRFEVIDKQSANGIRINGVELKRGLIEAGDALELGDVRLRFVGAGKIFRTGVETTQTAIAVPEAALSSRRSLPQISGSRGSHAGKVIALLIFLLLVVGGAIYAIIRSPPPSTKGVKPAVSAAPDADATALQQAKARLAANDVEEAHKLLQGISETSPTRDDPDFKDIEAKWADSMFAQVEKVESPEEKFRLLTTIVSTPSVDKERRDKAIQLMENLRKLHAELPQVPVTAGPSGFTGGTTSLPASGQGPSNKAIEPAAGAQGTQGTLDAKGEEAQRKSLEPKVWSGKATIDEIKMLKAICTHLGDRACRDRANAMLLQAQKNPR